MNPRHTLRLCLSALAAGLTLTSVSACSSGGSNLDDIKSHGAITIGTSGNNAPTIFRDPSGGFVGIDADWANLIAKSLGTKVEWKTLDFSGIVPGLQAKKFDIAMSGLRVTPDRQKVVDFSEPIGYDDAVAVYPQKETGITGPESIKGKSVCVVAGSSNGEAPVQRIGGAAKVTRYPGQAEAFSDLKNGRCDLMVTGRILALYWIKSGDGAGYEVSRNGTDGTALAVGVPKGSDALLQAVNKGIEDAKKAGAYQSIAQKWLGQPFKQ
ncbi:substrate-binding periplasmic protein [Amycolatopsis sp. NPDC004368]